MPVGKWQAGKGWHAGKAMGWAQGAGLGRMQGKTTDQGAKEFASFSPVNVTMYPELLSFHTSITTQVKLTDLT